MGAQARSAYLDRTCVAYEFDEGNDTHSARVTNQASTHPGDWDEDGDVDRAHFAEFLGFAVAPRVGGGSLILAVVYPRLLDLDPGRDVDLRQPFPSPECVCALRKYVSNVGALCHLGWL